MKKILRNSMIALASSLLTANMCAAVPENMGSIMRKNVPMHEQDNLSVLRNYTIDFKVVSLDGKSYAWVKTSDNSMPSGDGWGAQLRYWSESHGKLENNLLNRDAVNFYTTGEATSDISTMKSISIFMNLEGYSESPEYDYIATQTNSDVIDSEAPTLASATVEANGVLATLILNGSDNSGDLYYYVEDENNGFKTIVFTNSSVLSGLLEDKTYNLIVTPIDFNGNKGTSFNVPSFTTTAVSEVRILLDAGIWQPFEAWEILTHELVDGEGVHTVMNTGQAWAGLQVMTMPDNLGANGLQFSYVHFITKYNKSTANMCGKFGYGDTQMENASTIPNEWQDIIYKVKPDGSKALINELVLIPDFPGETTFPKDIYVREIVVNNSPESLVESNDKEKPVMTAASIVENSITYNSVELNLEATDNLGVASFIIVDEANQINKTAAATNNRVTVNGLAPNTSYSFVIKAKDLAGNISDNDKNVTFTTLDRQSECSGDLGHFGTPDVKKIHYEVSYDNGNVTYTINPLDNARTFDFAQVFIADKLGFTGMDFSQDGGKTATYTLQGVTPGEVLLTMFVYSLDDMDGNEQNGQFPGDGSDYVYYVAGDCPNPNSIENPQVSVVSVYPNPVIDELNITSDDEIISIAIYDVVGKLVKSVQVNTLTKTIGLGDLLAGNYFVNITKTDGSKITSKIIKL